MLPSQVLHIALQGYFQDLDNVHQHLIVRLRLRANTKRNIILVLVIHDDDEIN